MRKGIRNCHYFAGNYSFFCGIDQDSVPIVKEFDDQQFEWNYAELVNGAMNKISRYNHTFLFYSGDTEIMHSAMLFEKQ